MPKNIVLCCDGTSNEFGTRNTNVVRLFSTLVQDPARQLAYYHPGLGTMGAPGAWTALAQWFSRLLGLAFGRGLPEDLERAYIFVLQNFQPGDRIFLFGFSRGAYTVRALAGLLHMFGLIRSGNEGLVPYAIELLTNLNDHTFEVARQFKRTFSIDCKLHFVGVWDTVSSVGWFLNPLTIPYSADDPDIAVARHALAIDERRAFFRANLWRPSGPPPQHGPQDLKQVWFPGVHCDVGGGYQEGDSALSKVALAWMLREARNAGLEIDDAKATAALGGRSFVAYAPDDPAPPIHPQVWAVWWWAEFIPKRHYDWKTGTTSYRMNLFRRRFLPEGSLIHSSAFQRGPKYPKNKPTTFTVVD